MPVHEPGRRLMHHIPLEFVQHKVTGHGRRSPNAGLSLTSMIDFLIVVVVFLLMTFSASGETPLTEGVTIAKAENTLDTVEEPLVAVTGNQIRVDGTQAGNTRAIEDSKRLQRVDE